MFDPERMLGQMITGALGGRAAAGNPNSGLNAMGGFGAGGSGWKIGAGLGLLGVALAAFDHFKERPSVPPPGVLPPPPPPPGVPSRLAVTRELPVQPPPAMSAPRPQPPASISPGPHPALHLLRSMIAAAHADGRLDDSERQAIVGRAREAGLPAEDLMALGMEVATPRSLAQLLAETPPGLERETWAAALLAIQVDTAAEQQHLEQLAQALRLSPQDCAGIRAQLGLS